LGAKQGRTEWEACDWSPESSKRARISCPAAQRDFMDRTTQLFEELKVGFAPKLQNVSQILMRRLMFCT